MIDTKISEAIRTTLRTSIGDKAPGCVFYATRNGEPFLDASFGYARLASTWLDSMPHSQLAMSPNVMVHTGSVAKFICAVAILRLIQEWNIIHSKLELQLNHLHFPRNVMITEKQFVNSVVAYTNSQEKPNPFSGKKPSTGSIDLNTKIYPLVSHWLDKPLINKFKLSGSYPGTNVENITFLQLLNHASGLTKNDYNKLDGKENVTINEPIDISPVTFNLKTIITVLLKDDAVHSYPEPYNNHGYDLLGAIIEAVTGWPYSDWVRARLFREVSKYDHIGRKCIPEISTKYYFKSPDGTFLGNWHPDYTIFGACGGYYMTAVAFCDWMDKIMQKEPVRAIMMEPILIDPFTSNRGGPVLEDADRFYTDLLGQYRRVCGRYSGIEKNGNAQPQNCGGTNAVVNYLKGSDPKDRICILLEVNARGMDETPLRKIDASELMDEAIDTLAKEIMVSDSLLKPSSGSL